MTNMIFHKDIYDKLTNKIYVSEIGTDDDKVLQIFTKES